MSVHTWPILVAMVVAASVPAMAQDSRAASIAAAQADKAAHLAPRRSTTAERIVLWVERELMSPGGFYPLVGGVYDGGGLAAGAGYRYYSGDNTHWDIRGLYSVKGYRLAEISVASLDHAGGRIQVRARAGRRDATRVWFHGVGSESRAADRTDFALTQAYGGAEVTVIPLPHTVLGGGVSLERFNVSTGTGGGASTEEVFSPATAPGLDAAPTYLHATAAAGIDWRPARDYARRGGLYQTRYHRFADRDGRYSFSRLDGEVVHHVPLLREHWVVSLHGLAQTTLGDDAIVPFFLLPSLGGANTLRSFSAWRFRDRHSLLMNAELRWTPNRHAMDMALFYDAGKVAGSRRNLNLQGLASDVGIGVRFHGRAATPLRLDLARGSEGLRLVIAGSAAF